MANSISNLLWFICFAFSVICEPGFSQELATEKPQPNYLITETTFKSHDDVEMFGRLVLPQSNSPRAVVIYVQTAEGATIDMKRSLGNGKTFNYYDLYRENLTAMDIGFFSYEGRGIRMGEDPPRFERIDWDIYNTSTLENKVQDLLRAIEVVQHHDSLQHIPILLMGASEGTLLVAEAAARKPNDVRGLVLYGLLVKNLRETFKYIMSDGEFMKYQSLDEDKDNIITKVEWDKVVKSVDFSKADLNIDDKFTVADIEISTKKYLSAIDNEDFEVLQAWAKVGAAVAVPDGWFEDHFKHADSWSFLSHLRIPVGCFHGKMDRMTPISSVKELETKAKAAKLTKMEFYYFDDLDHSLNLGQYFMNGILPQGHSAIFEFIDRIAPAK